MIALANLTHPLTFSACILVNHVLDLPLNSYASIEFVFPIPFIHLIGARFPNLIGARFPNLKKHHKIK